MINRWLDRNRVQFGSRRVIRTLDFFMLQSRARRSILRRNGVEITGLNQIQAHAVNHFEYLLGSANLVTTASPIRVGNRLAQQISFHSNITIGADVTRACLNFFRSGVRRCLSNLTFLCLTYSQKDNPSRIDDYRPISLCNLLYKIIEKILANRLREVLDSLVGPDQTTFGAGTSIENVLFRA